MQLELYCEGKLHRDDLPENGFGFKLSDIFTAVEPRIYVHPNDPRKTWDNSTAGKHNPKPEWVKEIQKAEKDEGNVIEPAD